MIVADTGALVALIDSHDDHHEVLNNLFLKDPAAWIVPWAVLPEVDYLLASRVGGSAQEAFLFDLAEGIWSIEWGAPSDLERANELSAQYASLRLGLVDTVVMAIAERLGADAVATLDQRDFGAVEIDGRPRLLPRDL
ncbi:MAG TPA: PIN domain-containing protein [Acidobacteriota bacterium]|nr:PIN domain-containing protein [Acidobacteriota bacterium]